MNLEANEIRAQHYKDAIADLQRGLNQLQSMERGEGQQECRICGDTDHTAENCWYHNPLLLATVGRFALLGQYWRCFHCGAIYLDEKSALEHFGAEQDEVVKCLQDLAAMEWVK